MRYLEDSPLLQQAFKPFETAYQNQKKLGVEEQEAVYAAGYSFYESAHFEKAAGLFTHLIFSHPFDSRYWRGLASSKQMLREYKEALHAWAIVCLLDEKDPFPHFHAAESLYQMGQQEEALKALASAESLLSDSSTHGSLRLAIHSLMEVYRS